jgi:hypothetical protein
MAAWPRPGSPNPPSPDPLPGPRAYHRHRRPYRLPRPGQPGTPICTGCTPTARPRGHGTPLPR